jgi:DNA-binding GntR family transcriptional regulator
MMVEPLSVTSSIVENLRGRIIVGELRGGQRLNQNQLAFQLGISGPPIREAFRILEHEHVIVSVPRKGVYINEVTIKDCQEVYQMREMSECYAIDLLKAREISDLSEVFSTLDVASNLPIPPEYDRDQRLKYLKIFADFHIKLVEASGNDRLNYFYRSIQSTLYRYQFMYLSIPGAGPHSLEDHRQILSSVKTGAYDEAKEYLRSHIKHTFELLRDRMRKESMPG